MITDELFDHYEGGSAARVKSVLTGIDRFVFTTSDHMPVFARFIFPTNTSNSNRDDVPESLSVDALYPNPVGPSLQLGLATRTVDSATIEVFDILGRLQIIQRTAIFEAGERRVSVDTSRLVPGVYVIRISHGFTTKHARIVRISD